MGELARLHNVTTHNHSPFNAAVARYVEKLEQPDPRVAAAGFREKARGVGYVIKCLGIAGVLILLGLAVVLWQHERKEAAAGDTQSFALPKLPALDQPSASGETRNGEVETVKTVVDYTIFQTVEVSERLSVVTGWDYASSKSKAPERQYCYVSRQIAQSEDSSVYIARVELGQNRDEMPKALFAQKLPDLNYESTLAKCRWFSG